MRRLLSVERHQKILERVASENAVDFASLADELGVSSMTVRRDLRILEEAGYLKTTRGGASAQLVNTQDILQHPRAICLLYTSPSPRDGLLSRMPSSA